MRFERISKYPEVNLPQRATTGAAGYDFECADTVTILPHTICLLPTGIKCQIDDGCYLQLALRSSTPKKKGLMLANGIGIVDSDYYNNPDNEGHIMFQVYNFTDEDVCIEKGERIGQGVFIKYFKTDNDLATDLRVGGFGSTDITGAQKDAINKGLTASLDEIFGFGGEGGFFSSLMGGDCFND